MKTARLLLTTTLVLILTACGTVGGAMSGAGDDLRKAGDWVKSR
jgi:starvation-inducible outer membrane lipoprotein